MEAHRIPHQRVGGRGSQLKFAILLSVAALAFAAACTKPVPHLSLSSSSVIPGEIIVVKGEGFTPDKHALSHLRRPDQTEYEVLRFVTDAKGEYSHTILTQLFMTGTYELWSVDEETQTATRVEKIEVVQSRTR